LPGKRFRKGVLLLRDGQQSQERRTSCNNLVNRVFDARQLAPHKVRFREVAWVGHRREAGGRVPVASAWAGAERSRRCHHRGAASVRRGPGGDAESIVLSGKDDFIGCAHSGLARRLSRRYVTQSCDLIGPQVVSLNFDEFSVTVSEPLSIERLRGELGLRSGRGKKKKQRDASKNNSAHRARLGGLCVPCHPAPCQTEAPFSSTCGSAPGSFRMCSQYGSWKAPSLSSG
jgi:hypothetical protein